MEDHLAFLVGPLKAEMVADGGRWWQMVKECNIQIEPSRAEECPVMTMVTPRQGRTSCIFLH